MGGGLGYSCTVWGAACQRLVTSIHQQVTGWSPLPAGHKPSSRAQLLRMVRKILLKQSLHFSTSRPTPLESRCTQGGGATSGWGSNVRVGPELGNEFSGVWHSRNVHEIKDKAGAPDTTGTCHSDKMLASRPQDTGDSCGKVTPIRAHSSESVRAQPHSGPWGLIRAGPRTTEAGGQTLSTTCPGGTMLEAALSRACPCGHVHHGSTVLKTWTHAWPDGGVTSHPRADTCRKECG